MFTSDLKLLFCQNKRHQNTDNLLHRVQMMVSVMVQIL